MLTFTTSKLGLRYHEIWFAEAPERALEAAASQGADFAVFREARRNWNLDLREFRDAVIDLASSDLAIFERFEKKFRYEVRRAEKEDCIAVMATDTSWDSFEDAFQDYVAFCRRKKLSSISEKVMRSYASAGALTLSAALRHDVRLQYHIYLRDPEEAVLLASFPSRAGAQVESKIAGWGNRLLHWRDIQWFRNHGLCRYNLGGIGNHGSNHNENIIKFKLEMAPSVQTYYYGSLPVTWRAGLAQRARKLTRGR